MKKKHMKICKMNWNKHMCYILSLTQYVAKSYDVWLERHWFHAMETKVQFLSSTSIMYIGTYIVQYGYMQIVCLGAHICI
jgi:hypothetical protein